MSKSRKVSTLTKVRSKLIGLFKEGAEESEEDWAEKASTRNQGHNTLTDGIRGLVSKQKRRLKVDGYDLDLTYMFVVPFFPFLFSPQAAV